MSFEHSLDSFFAEAQAGGIVSGIVRVRIKDSLIYSRDFGLADYEGKTPFSDKSAFTLYSISKPFCAIGLMKLWDRGLVDLDAHPAKYVPEAAGLHPDVTLRQMLCHTSGVPDFGQTKDFVLAHAPGTRENLREHLKLISAYPQLFAPGTQEFYANVNFATASLVIENLTDSDYGEYMKKEVFAPLGMTDTEVDLPGKSIQNRVQGYRLDSGKLAPAARSLSWMRGAGDIAATPDDLYCLNLAIKHRQLLSLRAWEQILSPSPVNGMGLGCAVEPVMGKTCIRHNGGHVGFRTLHFQISEEDLDVIFLSNFEGNDIRMPLLNAACEFLFKSSPQVQPEMDKGYI